MLLPYEPVGPLLNGSGNSARVSHWMRGQVQHASCRPERVQRESATERRTEWLLVANLNATVVDLTTWQKLQGSNLFCRGATLRYSVRRLLPAFRRYDSPRELVRCHVLRLTRTAHDMAPFARDLGYNGPPFIWYDEERRRIRARLDAPLFPPL